MNISNDRTKCYKCYRPKSSCMCGYIHQIDTQTKFVILMHPKEYKKVKNGTGHLTNLTLKNSKLFVGIDFTNHKVVNEIIATYESFVLYPSKNALNLSDTNPYQSKENFRSKKKTALFLIDSTWACSIKMLRESKNLQRLQHVSFSSTKTSEFMIKQQPAEYCLSTIESTLLVLELLNKWQIENLSQNDLDKFLNPFYKMIEYQLKCIQNPLSNAVRFKSKKVCLENK